MGIYKEGEAPEEIMEELIEAKDNQNIDEAEIRSESIDNSETNSPTEGDMSTLSDAVSTEPVVRNQPETPPLQNIGEEVLDKGVILNDDNTNGSILEQRADHNSNNEEQIMRDEDLAKIAEMMRATVAPISERIEKLEDRPQVDARSVEKTQEKIEPTVQANVEVDALRKELADTRSMLNSVMAQPVRTGRHQTTHIRGVGSKNAYGEIISRAKTEGALALATIVEENIDDIAGEGSRDVTTRSQHDLVDLLAKGLRSAELDGLLGTKQVTNWN